MKKILLILMMFGLCVFFFLAVNNRKFDTDIKDKKLDTAALLEEKSRQLDEDYPKEPKAVVALNNKLLDDLYSKDMQESFVNTYVETVRKLYSKEFLSLNSKENQVTFIIAEMQQSKKKGVILQGSKIEEVEVYHEEQWAEVKVIHYLNTGDIKRTYKLVEEDDEWKIDSWENTKTSSDSSEE